MIARIPETKKKPGVCYAPTDDGVELPVIDITHPAFALGLSGEELEKRTEVYIREQERWERFPSFLRNLATRYFQKHSILARGGTGADGALLSGMSTYLMKLGPDNLGSGYASGIDRKVASAIPPTGVRIRLRDMARLLADALVPALESGDGPVALLNIAGGPAMDSLNALLLIRAERSDLLPGRSFRVLVLDTDEHGPRFGMRAAEALRSSGAPLEGLDLAVERIPYDWTHPAELADILRETRPAVGSSEGGLFEYGSDGDIVANLDVIRENTPDDFVLAGSLLKDDRVTRVMRRNSALAIRYLGADAFSEIVRRAGWTIARMLDGPTIHTVALRKTSLKGESAPS